MSKQLTEKSERLFLSIKDSLQDNAAAFIVIRDEAQKRNPSLFAKARNTDMSGWSLSSTPEPPQIGGV
jgi:hypothetical protein